MSNSDSTTNTTNLIQPKADCEPIGHHAISMTEDDYVARSKWLSYEAMEACAAYKDTSYYSPPVDATLPMFMTAYDQWTDNWERYWKAGKQWLELAYCWVESNQCNRNSVERVFDDLYSFYLCNVDEDFLDYPLFLLTSCCDPGHDPSFRSGHAAILKYMPYALYLRTFHWQRTRDFAHERAGHRCQVCNSPERLDVHHRTYERRGAELPEDLIVLCRKCHETFHKNGRLAR